MTHQAIDKALKKWYKPLMAVVCLGLMFGHMVSITPSLTAMHIFIAITVALALLYKTTTSRIFLLTGGYFLIYGAWTLAVTLLWGRQHYRKGGAKVPYHPSACHCVATGRVSVAARDARCVLLCLHWIPGDNGSDGICRTLYRMAYANVGTIPSRRRGKVPSFRHKL